MKVKFKRFSSHARVPGKETLGSACFDVFSARCITLEPGVTRSIKMDIGLKFPKKYVARLSFRAFTWSSNVRRWCN